MRWRDVVREHVQVRRADGQRIEAHGVVITPQSAALILRWPNGGFVWNQPLGLIVERDGHTERVPIINVNRVAIWTWVGLTLIGLLMTWRLLHRS